MKKFTLLYIALIVLMASGLSFSQFYVKLGGGYNLGLNPDNLGANSTGGTSEVTSYEAVNGSFGEGINFSGVLGYELASNLGLELDVIYKLSTEFEEKDQYGSETSTTTMKGSFLAFAPTFVVSAPSQNVSPYAKIGLLIAIPTTEYEFVDNEGNTGKATFNGGVEFGLAGGAGILVPISSKIDFYAEVDFVSFNWKPDEVEVTDPDGETETFKFEDEWTSDDDNTEGPWYIPFSNVGLNVGVQIGL